MNTFSTQKPTFHVQLACIVCGRHIEVGDLATKKHSIESDSNVESQEAHNDEIKTFSDSQTETSLHGSYSPYNHTFGMKTDSKQTCMEGMNHSLSSYCYCQGCEGLVCSICSVPQIEALSCPQCLASHQVSSSVLLSSSSQQQLSSLKSSKLPSSTIEKKEGDQQSDQQQSTQSSLDNEAKSKSDYISSHGSMVSSSASTQSSINLTGPTLNSLFSNRCKKCSECPECHSPSLGFKSIQFVSLPKEIAEQIKQILTETPNQAQSNQISLSNTSSSISLPSAITYYSCSYCRWNSLENLPSSNASSDHHQQHHQHSSSSLLFSDSSTKLIAKSLSIEREKVDKTFFQNVAKNRKNMFLSKTSHHKLKSNEGRFQEGKSHENRSHSPFEHASSNLDDYIHSTSSPYSMSSLLMKRKEVESKTSMGPSDPHMKYKSKYSQHQPHDEQTDQVEESDRGHFEALDEAWRICQRFPLSAFKPISRAPKSNHNFYKERLVSMDAWEPSDGVSKADLLSKVVVPERVALVAVCSKKCLKCDRILIKPSLNTQSSDSIGAFKPAVSSNHLLSDQITNSGNSSFNALPDFKRRHSAMAYTPSISVTSEDSYGDYKPTLKMNEWNMLSLTISNPPSLPAIHISISSNNNNSQFKKDDDNVDGELDSSEKSLKVGLEANLSSTPSNASKPSQTTQKSESLPNIIECQVDCAGCDTWILEDEPISIEENFSNETNVDEQSSNQQSDAKSSKATSWFNQPGVPSHMDLLDKDSENPAILSRSSRKVSLVVLVMPEIAPSILRKNPDIDLKRHQFECEMYLEVSWPAATTNSKGEQKNFLRTPIRVNLNQIFNIENEI